MGTALAFGTCLGGIAFAQGAKAPDIATPPAQSKQAPVEQMQQPGATGMQQPSTPAPTDQTEAVNPSLDTIKAAQQQLKTEGLYAGAIDGRVGPATKAAVRQYQQKNGLKQTAMLDKETLQRLLSQQPHG
jgi:peptidoglycan hydrolase-like protein with peptidoglycan-binding domain